jgi:hypothetical protein
MKRKGELSKALKRIAAGLYLLASLSAPSAASQEGDQISGIVTDEFSSFIAGANIRLYSLDRILQTKSDTTGHFRLKNLPAGTYDLEVTASGFKTKTIEQVKVSDEASRLTYEVPLKINIDCPPLDSISYAPNDPSGRMVEGVVVDAGSAATPLSGVEVRLLHASDKPTSHETNERGQFQFRVETPGKYSVEIVRPGYQPAQSQQFWITREGRTVMTMRQVKVGMLIVCQ